MNPAALPVLVQPALAEEAVLRRISGYPEERGFRRDRDRLYKVPDAEVRERAFEDFHLAWFGKLGLGSAIDKALAELPILGRTCARCVVTRALARRDEGADLLVAGEGGPTLERTVSIRLRPAAFDAPDALLPLLRFELLHVADMVDPDFGYSPQLPPADGGPAHAQLIRDRYRAAWDAGVIGRLVARGAAGDAERAHAYRAFASAFPMLGSGVEAEFARFFERLQSHETMMGFAASPLGTRGQERLVPGGRCPLCRFPTHAPEPDPKTLPEEVVGAIRKDFPEWEPVRGLCCQCAEIYRVRPLASEPTNMLLGS